MKNKLTIAIFLFALLIAAGGALAQGGPYGAEARLLAELDRTDEIIALAREAVIESGSERARQLFQAAKRLQKMSRQMYDQVTGSFDGVAVTQATRHSLDARTKAQRAIAITRQADENRDYVRRRLERSAELIGTIVDRVDESTPPAIMGLIDSARERQERATELFRSGRLKGALQMTMQVEKSLESLRQRVGGMRKAQKQYGILIDRYVNLRNRIEASNLAGEPKVQNQLRLASQHRERAEQHVLTGQYRQAEKAMQEAVETLYRLAERMREPAQIGAVLEQLQAQARKLQEAVAGSGDQAVRNSYQSAVEHLNKAERMYQERRFDDAATRLQAARQLLAQVRKFLGE